MESFCDPEDVATKLLRPLTASEAEYVDALILEASAQLRQQATFDIDARIAAFNVDPTAYAALSPVVAAGVTATIVKRYLLNVQGVATSSETVGPYARSMTFVNRYDKTGSDVRGEIRVTQSDLDQLLPTNPTVMPGAVLLGLTDTMLPTPGSYNERVSEDADDLVNDGWTYRRRVPLPLPSANDPDAI